MTGDMAGSGWPLLAAVGCASGLLSGLLGIGGGLILSYHLHYFEADS
jgi:uncharacterized membrane protein YfcA